MKHFLVFTAIFLVSNTIFACGFYPFGEDIRFSFLNPANFNYYSYSEFNYSSNSFYANTDGVFVEGTVDENEKLWMKYCKNKVAVEAIRAVLYEFKEEDICPESTNEMLRYLYKTKKIEAVNYLKFAKKCEFFNGLYDDPWETKHGFILPEREKLIDEAVLRSNKFLSKELKHRYTFLAIRLAYYNNDRDKIRTLYDSVFKNQKKADILKYWSLYFRTIAEKNRALANFYAAQVFVNAPDKRFMIAQEFNTKIALDLVLKYAKTDKEKANVYLLAGIKKTDQSLYCLKQVYKYNPDFDGLSFLLLREVNKIEDWVFTPYYSLFNPSVSEFKYGAENESNSVKDVLKRVEKDRVYAGEVLKFINSVNIKKIDNPILWKISRMYLSLVTKDNQSCLNQVAQLEKKISKKDSLYSQIELIKALALTANQQNGKAVILDEVKPILLKNQKNKKFLFAIGRELEYKANTTDAAFLYSKISDVENDSNDYNIAVWKSLKNKRSSYTHYYNDYFTYIDVNYSTKQVESILAEIEKKDKDLDSFSVWKQRYIKNEITILYDLIGVKYMRQNNLESAVSYFSKSNKTTKYSDCLWEKPNCTGIMFNVNPFYVLKYTPNFILQEKQFQVNERSVAEHLILYLKKASSPKEENKDYYYFLVANAYFNMTHEGNSWMMRRFSRTEDIEESPFEDKKEYYQCNLAKKYYLLSFKNAKTKKFKALCLRMIGKCEKNKLQYQYPNDYYHRIENYDAFLWNKNRYYQDLKSNYADDYENLISDCSSFEEYFKARR
ncbi:hypothetical protein GKZ90_0014630 [Flavobacterium sp. MC2016-06]|uniref:hypothetical protein n=1 Tax=Flavobacterium sp. MC2016-06 TaxID=2676308 RepID=UPI0012BAE453|nr:hypothetical protein [Flavobacterium sp. MC2016-06]MBU3859255.1 hypothetical protein [Flavobacterium sp. MC2016-06]